MVAAEWKNMAVQAHGEVSNVAAKVGSYSVEHDRSAGEVPGFKKPSCPGVCAMPPLKHNQRLEIRSPHPRT